MLSTHLYTKNRNGTAGEKILKYRPFLRIFCCLFVLLLDCLVVFYCLQKSFILFLTKGGAAPERPPLGDGPGQQSWLVGGQAPKIPWIFLIK